MSDAERLASVVIPTYNRAYVLRQTLPTYLEQTGVGEIIVVDDASTDNTQDVVRSFQGQSPLPIYYVRHEKRRGVSAARNTGASAATCPLLVFGEDDLIFEAEYVSVLIRKLETLNADIIGGLLVYLIPDESCEEGRKRYRRQMVDGVALFDPDVIALNLNAKVVADTPVPCAHSCVLTRTELVQRLRFDEQYRGNAYREETDFHVSVLAQGGRIYITPDVACFHLPRMQASTGGHHSRHWLAYEYWTIRNNNYFIHKHYRTLQSYFGWTRSEARVKLDFARHRWQKWIWPHIAYDARESVKPYVPKTARSLIRRLLGHG